MLAEGHAVVCKDTGAIMFVDFVFEDTRRGQCYLACIYEAACRGGPVLEYARSYMRNMQRVCNQDMSFFPRVLAMCVYEKRGSDSDNNRAKIYARDVGIY